ncbi:hypothetical protein [Moorena producens]
MKYLQCLDPLPHGHPYSLLPTPYSLFPVPCSLCYLVSDVSFMVG